MVMESLIYVCQKGQKGSLQQYIWKILGRFIPNFRLKSYANSRTGRHCLVPKTPTLPSKYKTIYCNSLEFKSLQLFNIFPKDLRQLHDAGVNIFKTQLGLFLINIPDETISGKEAQLKAASSKYLMHQIPVAKKNW